MDIKNGSNGARTHDLSRVRRTLIPAELCFHSNNYSIIWQKCKEFLEKAKKYGNAVFISVSVFLQRAQPHLEPKTQKKGTFQ